MPSCVSLLITLLFRFPNCFRFEHFGGVYNRNTHTGTKSPRCSRAVLPEGTINHKRNWLW